MTQDLRELLAWYADAGVDAPLRDTPVDRFAESDTVQRKSPPSPRTSSTAPAPAPQPPVSRAEPPLSTRKAVPDENAIETAKKAAQNASDLAELKMAIETFEDCNLKAHARSTVFADGNPEAKIMLIGEAPGRDEDAQGLPFVGRSGQLLNRMLGAIGLDRESVYITNVIPWRPPGNRTPTPVETEICRPFVERHIRLVDPHILVLLGGSSAKTLLRTTKGIMSLRGRWQTVTADGAEWPAMPTYHPAFLLRQPNQKKPAWQDLLSIRTKSNEINELKT